MLTDTARLSHYKNFSVIKMHGTTIKIIDAQQAKLRNKKRSNNEII